MNTALKAGLIFLAVLGVTLGLLSLGSSYGVAKTEVKYLEKERKHQAEIDRLKTEYGTKEEEHRREQSRLSQQIRDQEVAHTAALDRAGKLYAERLRQSETRAGVYKRQAEGGATECRNLADHAARLDASLEEARFLVREVGITLGQRDNDIRALSDQIRADRKLFE